MHFALKILFFVFIYEEIEFTRNSQQRARDGAFSNLSNKQNFILKQLHFMYFYISDWLCLELLHLKSCVYQQKMASKLFWFQFFIFVGYTILKTLHFIVSVSVINILHSTGMLINGAYASLQNNIFKSMSK